MGWVLDGSNWVRNCTVRSSTGSTQNVVLAAPPQLYSPGLEMTLAFTASMGDCEPQPEPHPVEGRLGVQGTTEGGQVAMFGQVVAHHVVDGTGTEQPHALQLAASTQHLGEAVVVPGGGHHPSTAGEADRRAERGSPADGLGSAVTAGAVEGGQPIGPGLVDEEPGVGHPQGSEDALGEEAVEALAGDHLDQPPEYVGGDRVVPFPTGVEQQRQLGVGVTDTGEVQVGGAGPFEAGGPVEGVDGVGVVEPVGEAGGVGEQVPYPDGLHGRTGQDTGTGAAVVDPGLAPRRQVAMDGILQLEGPLLAEHEGSHGRDRLGHRVHPPQSVDFDRQPCLAIPVSVGGQMGQFSVAGHGYEVAGQAPIIDVVGEMAVDAGQPVRVETDLGGVDLDLQFAHESEATWQQLRRSPRGV